MYLTRSYINIWNDEVYLFSSLVILGGGEISRGRYSFGRDTWKTDEFGRKDDLSYSEQNLIIAHTIRNIRWVGFGSCTFTMLPLLIQNLLRELYTDSFVHYEMCICQHSWPSVQYSFEESMSLGLQICHWKHYLTHHPPHPPNLFHIH